MEVEARVLDLSVLLVAQRQRAPGKDEIIRHIWGCRPVTNAALGQLVYKARSAPGNDERRIAGSWRTSGLTPLPNAPDRLRVEAPVAGGIGGNSQRRVYLEQDVLVADTIFRYDFDDRESWRAGRGRPGSVAIGLKLRFPPAPRRPGPGSGCVHRRPGQA